MSKLKHKVSYCKDCEAGLHTFIPTSFKVSGNANVCTIMTCQHCLVTVDKREQEVVSLDHNCSAEKKEQAEKEKSKPKPKTKSSEAKAQS